MAETVGRVSCMRVGDDYGVISLINNATRQSEVFVLWWFPTIGIGIPPELTSYTRVMHSMWISLLREARTNNLNVTIVHPDLSPVVLAVQLG
jgi:hypothetical protein